jgi:hypothetical protein
VHGKCHGVGQPVVRRCACSSAQRRRTSPKCKTVLAKLPAEIVDQTGDAARAADGQSPPNRTPKPTALAPSANALRHIHTAADTADGRAALHRVGHAGRTVIAACAPSSTRSP